MAVPEQFSLRWNDFHTNLTQSFHSLLEGEDLVDVTLAAGGKYVQAHKVILSVCSPYFKELFKLNPCEHPIVVLKDVAHQELKQLLQFMYRGEVHVRRQELSAFLHTAEMLQVKGLTNSRDRSESPPINEPIPQQAKYDQHQPIDIGNDSQSEWIPGGEDTIATEALAETECNAASNAQIILKKEEDASRSPLKRLLKNTSNKNSHNVKKRNARPVNASPTHTENTECASDSEPQTEYDSKDLFHTILVLPEAGKETGGMQYADSPPDGWNCKSGGVKIVKCPSCHRFFANRYNLKVHIRDKHDTREGTLTCEICQKRMRNPSCLRVHMYHHRKQAAYLASLGHSTDQLRQNVSSPKHGWQARAEPSAVNTDQRMPDEQQNVSGPKHGWPVRADAADPNNENQFQDDEQDVRGPKHAWHAPANASVVKAEYQCPDEEPASGTTAPPTPAPNAESNSSAI